MEFRPDSKKGFITTKLIKSSVGQFDGQTLSIAAGDTQPLNRRKFLLLMRKVVAVAKQHKLKQFGIAYADIKSYAPAGMSDFEMGQVAGSAFVMADYEHVSFKSKPKEGWNFVETIAITNTPKEGKEGFWRGHQIATEVNACRELANTPAGNMTPKILAEAAKRSVKGTKATVKVLGEKEMQKLGMGAVLGVGKGSAEESQFIVMEYWGAPKSVKPIVLVGKGVTFDTGGLQIKPGDGMYEMHMDMSGGAATIHAVALAAKLGLKANVVGLIPAVENAASGSAMRPGDMLKSLSGKMIEILHTDAEGRVILADALTYAKRYNPQLVVDSATLTGAALIALGQQASAYMTNREELLPTINALGEQSGDYVWPLPLWEEYDDMTKSTFGDVPNISTAGNSRYGGVIAGGKFLEVFAKELGCPWIHIDMAPRMVSISSEHLAKGAVGAPLRLLYAIIEKYAHQR